MADAVLTDEVKDVLRRATVDGNVLYLPEGQLDRKLYEAVNKALTNAGGKYQRAWPCRYRDARQCARDTMLGVSCPKVCNCKCHADQVGPREKGND